jgi:hypothetical protein
MIILLLSGIVEDPDPSAMWTMAGVELVIECLAVIGLVLSIVW